MAIAPYTAAMKHAQHAAMRPVFGGMAGISKLGKLTIANGRRFGSGLPPISVGFTS